MPVYVLHMIALSDRIENLREQVGNTLELKVVHGYHGGGDMEEQLKSLIRQLYGTEWLTRLDLNKEENKKKNNGRMACALGHLKILLQAEREGEDTIFILEDDAMSADWEKVKQTLASMPRSADSLQLYYLGYLMDKSHIETLREADDVWVRAECGKGVGMDQRVWATHAYVVFGVKALIAELRGLPRAHPIDVALSKHIIQEKGKPAYLYNKFEQLAEDYQPKVHNLRQFGIVLQDFRFESHVSHIPAPAPAPSAVQVVLVVFV